MKVVVPELFYKKVVFLKNQKVLQVQLVHLNFIIKLKNYLLPQLEKQIQFTISPEKESKLLSILNYNVHKHCPSASNVPVMKKQGIF